MPNQRSKTRGGTRRRRSPAAAAAAAPRSCLSMLWAPARRRSLRRA
uniref:Uncharacterized protein n=1 Tax=Arundo donax TaxID=35708 RepID=A0A0A9EUN6_ARUDO